MISKIKKPVSILLALMMVVSLFTIVPMTVSAAPTESLLITINSVGYGEGDADEFISGSRTFDNIATVTFSSQVYNTDDDDGWYIMDSSDKILSVAPAAGYTITKVKFYNRYDSAFDETSPFEATLNDYEVYVNGSSCGVGGVNKIEVYGYATPAHTEHTYTANPTFNWSQDASTGDWNCNNLTLTCSDCDATQDYEVAGFYGTSAVTCTANTDGSFTYSVSKTVDGTKYEDSKTYNANGVVKSATQLKAAAKKGGSWELGSDIDGVVNVVCADGFVLDGKDHIVTRNSNVDTNPVFRTTAAAAEITLKNLSIDGIAGRSNFKPAISSTASGNNTGNIINLENVKITNYDFDVANNGVVLAWGHATVNMKNCTVDTDSDYDVWGGAASKVNISGGTVGAAYLNGGSAQAAITDGATVSSITAANGSKIATDDPAKISVGEDYKLKDNGDGTYTVVPKDYVAQVGTAKYETLEAAVAAISTVTSEYHSKSGLTINKYKANGTIKLLADCSGNGIVIDSGSNLTIDFDGHKYDVTGDLVGSNGTESLGFQLLQNSDVTFTNGTITSKKAQMIVQNYSNLTLNNMVLDGTKMAGDGNYVLSNNNGNVVINDTTINARENCIAFDVCRYANYPSVNVTVKGDSHINGDVEVYASKSDAKDGFSLKLEGGDMSGDIVLDKTAKNVIAASPEKAVITKAAAFEKAAPADYKWDSNGKLVPCKYVAQVGDNKYETLEEAVAAISTVTSEYHSKSGLTINKYKANGTIKLLADCSGNGIVIDSGSNLTIDFDGHTYDVTGDLVGSNGTESLGFQLKQNSDVTFTNGTITSKKAQMIVQNYSNLTLNNMVLDGTKMAGDGNYVLSNNNGNVVINDTTINAREGKIAFDVCRYASYPSVNVTVKGDSHINGNVEVFASKSDPKNGFSLKLEGGDMSGAIVLDQTAKNVLETAPDKLSVTKAAGFNQAAPEGYVWVDTATAGVQTIAKAVAQVGDNKYATLEAAVAAISTVTPEYHSKSGLTINKYKANGTIKLLADCSGNGIVIDSGSNLTIDFDGHKYDVTGDLVGSNGTESLGFQLLQNSDVTFTNGTITSKKAKMIVQNYSNLTLDNMVLDGTNMAGDGNYVLSNNNGNVVINDTTINAREGKIAFDVCRYASYPSVNVTVKGDSHINGNVEVFASKSDPKNGFSLKLEGGDMSGDIVLDKTAKNVLEKAPDKLSVTKAASFNQAAPEGYVWVDTATEGVQTIAKAVAQVGDNKYATLEEAVAAISTVTPEYHSKSGLTINKYKANGTIKLLADCSGNGIVIDSGSNLTIDFDGHKYDVTGDLVGSNGTESLGFQLLQNSDVTFTNGTITSEKAKMIVQNYSNLTLDNMVLDGTNMAGDGNYVLSNNNGNVVINDTTINAREGKIAFDVCRYSSYPSVNVTVTGNSHINGNVEVFASKSDPKNGFSLNLEGGDMTGAIVLDQTAKNAMENNPDKVSVNKATTFDKAAPEGYKWVDKEGKQTLAKIVKLFDSHSITLDGDIGVNFFINPAAVGANDTATVSVKFTWDGQDRTVEATYDEEKELFKATCYVVAAEMASNIHAVATVNNVVQAEEDDYTVQEYAEELYNNPNAYAPTEEKAAKLKELAKALLNYGAMAQTVFVGDFTVQPTERANANLAAEDKTAYESVNAEDIGAAIPEQASDMNKVAEKLGGKFYTSSVIYLNQNKLRLYFTPNSYPGTLPYGGQYTKIVEGYYYYVESEAIPAAKLDQQQHFNIGGVDFHYSALDYAKAVVKSNMGPEAVNLAKALFCYYQAAKAYKAYIG